MCYDMSMNIRERKTITWRLLSAFFLLLVEGYAIFSLIRVISLKPDGIVLDSIALGLAIFFPLAQMVIILRGWKKESHLTDIFLNTNGRINTVFLVAAIIASVFAVGLDVLGLVVFLRGDTSITGTCALHVITSIATYLMANCGIYFLYIGMFKKKTLSIEDYAK